MIRIRGLKHTYPGGAEALKGVDLDVARGEFLLLCGPNGSGKSTLIRHINALLEPFGGTVEVNGMESRRHARDVRALVGMVFQDADSQIIGETVWEDTAFGPENMGLSADEIDGRVREALEATGILELADRPCYALSGGEKRRLALAGVLAMRPEVLIFDEPFVNLDYRGVRAFLTQLLRLHQAGHTILLTTHDVEKVAPLADRVALLTDGVIHWSGPPSEMVPRLRECGVRPPCYALLGGEPISWLDD